MKKNLFYYLFAVICTIGLFTSCSDDDEKVVNPIPQTTFNSENGLQLTYGEFYQFNLSSCIRQQNSLTAQFVSFSLSNLANIFYPPQFLQ